jgi:hypothetical protein
MAAFSRWTGKSDSVYWVSVGIWTWTYGRGVWATNNLLVWWFDYISGERKEDKTKKSKTWLKMQSTVLNFCNALKLKRINNYLGIWLFNILCHINYFHKILLSLLSTCIYSLLWYLVPNISLRISARPIHF